MSACVAGCSSWHCNLAIQDWGQLLGPSPHPAHLLPGQFRVGIRASGSMIHRPGRCLGCGWYWNADRPQPRAGCPNSEGTCASQLEELNIDDGGHVRACRHDNMHKQVLGPVHVLMGCIHFGMPPQNVSGNVKDPKAVVT